MTRRPAQTCVEATTKTIWMCRPLGSANLLVITYAGKLDKTLKTDTRCWDDDTLRNIRYAHVFRAVYRDSHPLQDDCPLDERRAWVSHILSPHAFLKVDVDTQNDSTLIRFNPSELPHSSSTHRASKLKHHLRSSLPGDRRGLYHAFAVKKTVARHEAAATCDDCGERGHTAAACQRRMRNLSLMNTSRCRSCNDTHARGSACASKPQRKNTFIRTCVSGGALFLPRGTFSRP